MTKLRVLFLCVHNSAQSQMAEALLAHYGGDLFEVMSAGIEPGELNPFAVEVMRETGIDISGNRTKSAFDLYRQKMSFSYVITVCDRETAERCPIFPGMTTRTEWPLPDPASFTGTDSEIRHHFRALRDEIKSRVMDFIGEKRKSLNA